jgi:hypothetical protein
MILCVRGRKGRPSHLTIAARAPNQSRIFATGSKRPRHESANGQLRTTARTYRPLLSRPKQQGHRWKRYSRSTMSTTQAQPHTAVKNRERLKPFAKYWKHPYLKQTMWWWATLTYITRYGAASKGLHNTRQRIYYSMWLITTR